jgi:hypothetical protein
MKTQESAAIPEAKRSEKVPETFIFKEQPTFAELWDLCV